MSKKQEPPLIVPSWLDELGLTPYQFRVLGTIARRCGKEDKCWASIETLATTSSISENVVRRIIQELEALQLISIKRNLGRTNTIKLIKYPAFLNEGGAQKGRVESSEGGLCFDQHGTNTKVEGGVSSNSTQRSTNKEYQEREPIRIPPISPKNGGANEIELEPLVNLSEIQIEDLAAKFSESYPNCSTVPIVIYWYDQIAEINSEVCHNDLLELLRKNSPDREGVVRWFRARLDSFDVELNQLKKKIGSLNSDWVNLPWSSHETRALKGAKAGFDDYPFEAVQSTIEQLQSKGSDYIPTRGKFVKTYGEALKRQASNFERGTERSDYDSSGF